MKSGENKFYRQNFLSLWLYTDRNAPTWLQCTPASLVVVDVFSNRSSVEQDRKADNDGDIEAYDNVPLDNSSTASQNGFVSIITSKRCVQCVIVVIIWVMLCRV